MSIGGESGPKGTLRRTRPPPADSPRLATERQRLEDFRKIKAADFEPQFEALFQQHFVLGGVADANRLIAAVESSPLARAPELAMLPADARALAVLMHIVFSFSQAVEWLPSKIVDPLIPPGLDETDRIVELYARDSSVVGTWWVFLGLGFLADPNDAWAPGSPGASSPTLRRGSQRLNQEVLATRPALSASTHEKLNWVIQSMTGRPGSGTPTWHALISDDSHKGAGNLFAFDAGPDATPRTMDTSPMTSRGKCLAETFLRAWTEGAGTVLERHRDVVEELMTRASL